MSQEPIKDVFSLASEVEAVSFALEDVDNLFVVFRDEIWKEVSCIKPDQPATVQQFKDRFSVLYSMTSIMAAQLRTILSDLDHCSDLGYQMWAELRKGNT